MSGTMEPKFVEEGLLGMLEGQIRGCLVLTIDE